jgi:hypothetical protein
MSKTWRPTTNAPMPAMLGPTSSAGACVTFTPLPSIGSTSPFPYHSNSGRTSSFSSAMKPSTDTTSCITTSPIAPPFARDLVVQSNDVGARTPRSHGALQPLCNV